MQQRGRKSAANLAALSANGASSRLTPPSSLSDRERTIFASVVASVDHLRASDVPLLTRYVEAVALSDHAAEKLRADVMAGRSSHWLSTQTRLVKLVIDLARQLRLAPLSRSGSADRRTLARHNGHAPSAYEMMALERTDDAQ